MNEVQKIEATLGQFTPLHVAGEILEGGCREAQKPQLKKLTDAQRRLGAAVRRTETIVKPD